MKKIAFKSTPDGYGFNQSGSVNVHVEGILVQSMSSSYFNTTAGLRADRDKLLKVKEVEILFIQNTLWGLLGVRPPWADNFQRGIESF